MPAGVADGDTAAPAPVEIAAKAQAPAQPQATDPLPTPPRTWHVQAAAPPVLKGPSESSESARNPVAALVGGFLGALASLFSGDLPATPPSAAPVVATPTSAPKAPPPRSPSPAAVAEHTPASEIRYDDPLLGGLVAFIANNKVFEPASAPAKP